VKRYLFSAILFSLLSSSVYAQVPQAKEQSQAWNNIVAELQRLNSIPEGQAWLKKQTVGCTSLDAIKKLMWAIDSNNLEEAKAIKECHAFSENISVKILDIPNPLNVHVHLNLPDDFPGGLDYFVMITNIEKQE
jgi:hypothetical protein